MERGEFDNLPGAGKPLDLDNNPFVPTELRMAYKVLKNAGVVPQEVETHNEIRSLESHAGGTWRTRPSACAPRPGISLSASPRWT